jgi:hypothetical protein
LSKNDRAARENKKATTTQLPPVRVETAKTASASAGGGNPSTKSTLSSQSIVTNHQRLVYDSMRTFKRPTLGYVTPVCVLYLSLCVL